MGKLLNKISNSASQHKELEDEFIQLTRIGNLFQFRHFDHGNVPLESKVFIEYLFFQMLSLIIPTTLFNNFMFFSELRKYFKIYFYYGGVCL